MTFAVFVVQIQHAMNGFRLFARCLRKSFRRSSRRCAKRDFLSQIFEQFEYALDNCSLARAGTAGYDLYAVFYRFLDGGDLIFVQRKSCASFKRRNLAFDVHSEIGRFLLQLQKFFGDILFGVKVFLQKDCGMLFRFVSYKVAEHHHIHHIVAHSLLYIVTIDI